MSIEQNPDGPIDPLMVNGYRQARDFLMGSELAGWTDREEIDALEQMLTNLVFAYSQMVTHFETQARTSIEVARLAGIKAALDECTDPYVEDEIIARLTQKGYKL